MNYHFSPQSSISPSATLQMNTAAAKLRMAGTVVHNLSVGEANIPTDPVILSAAQAAITADHTNYLPEAGLPELRDLVSAWMNNTYGAHFSRPQTTITAGGKHGLLLLLQILVSLGDEVLIPSPYWVSYPNMVELVGGVSRIIHTSDTSGWKLTPELLIAAINDRTRVLILNSAANPTGVVYTQSELEALLHVAKTHNIIVISDEVYSTLVYDGEYISCSQFSAYQNIVCVVQSFSKHVAMTGWRIGAVLAPDPISVRLQTLQGQSTSGASSISQYAAIGAMNDIDRITSAMKQALQTRRDMLVTCLAAYGVDIRPAISGLYQFVPLTAFGEFERSSIDWCEYMLEQKHVATVPGIAFGAEGYVRLSFGGTEDTIQKAVEALCKD